MFVVIIDRVPTFVAAVREDGNAIRFVPVVAGVGNGCAATLVAVPEFIFKFVAVLDVIPRLVAVRDGKTTFVVVLAAGKFVAGFVADIFVEVRCRVSGICGSCGTGGASGDCAFALAIAVKTHAIIFITVFIFKSVFILLFPDIQKVIHFYASGACGSATFFGRAFLTTAFF
jgi:hypothetical protein